MWEIERFLARQNGTHEQALKELRAGRKLTHWIWWEMPQLSVLGQSSNATVYGLSGLDEAKAYLDHPVLCMRLLELCNAMLDHKGQAPDEILGAVDAVKVRSMATLFSNVAGAPGEFQTILDAFYGGVPCPLTLVAIN